jgi:hypothetical protein
MRNEARSAEKKPGFAGLRYRSGPGHRWPWLLRIYDAWAAILHAPANARGGVSMTTRPCGQEAGRNPPGCCSPLHPGPWKPRRIHKSMAGQNCDQPAPLRGLCHSDRITRYRVRLSGRAKYEPEPALCADSGSKHHIR